MNTPTATTDTTGTEIRPGSIETIYDGQVGIMIQGYASVFNERDEDDQFTTGGMAFKALVDEWERPEDRRLLYNHGTDPKLGHRRIGKVTSHQITPTGLVVECFVPRDHAIHVSLHVRQAERTRLSLLVTHDPLLVCPGQLFARRMIATTTGVRRMVARTAPATYTTASLLAHPGANSSSPSAPRACPLGCPSWSPTSHTR